MIQHLKPALFLCLFGLSATLMLQAQTTRLIIKEKGKNLTSVSISLCDKAGSKSIAPESFRKSDKVYFLVEPDEGYNKPVFRESEVKEDLPKIVLWQPEPAKYLVPDLTPVINDKRIVAVILAYPKSETRAHLPFSFGKDGSTSDELTLQETYFDHYPQFKSVLDEVNRQISAGDFLEAYYGLTNFLQKEDATTHLRYYSFANKLTNELPLLALSKGAEQVKAAFDSKLESFDAEPSKSKLEALQAASGEVERYLRLTSGYKDMGFEASGTYASLSTSLENMIKEKYSKSEQRYLESRFDVLMGQNYFDQRFSTFIDLIYKSMLNTIGAKGGSISPALSIRQQEELRQLGWLEDLQELFYAMNRQFKAATDPSLLPQNVLQHIESLKGTQPKPYFEVISLASTSAANSELRSQLIQTAIKCCPDEEELALLELWKATFENDKNGLAPTLNYKIYLEGIQQMQSKNFVRAAELFDQALRQQPNDARAWYFRALAHFKAGENFAAEAKLDKALELDHELVTAILLKIKLLLENKNYDVIAQIFSRPVSNGPVFLFDMSMASFLIKQNKASDAIKLLESGPVVLCPAQTAPYFLLGDAYAAMKQTDKARQSYLRTQQINPFDSSLFEEKMRALEKK